MHWRTEDLLSLRDGEPLDAAERKRLESLPEADAELRRLSALREKLRGLPELEPPAAAWNRIEARLAPGRRSSKRSIRRVAAVAAGVATLALAASLLALRLDALREPDTAIDAERDYHALLAESARLERLLLRIPPQRGIRQVSTASTIAGLEDQIAWIDALISESAALDTDAEYRQTLWRERVTVMNALVDVRYAQAPMRVYPPEL